LTPRLFDTQTPSSSFKKPFLPASAGFNGHARQTIGPRAHHVRAGTTESQASSFTLPPSPRNQCGASIAWRTSDVSARTDSTQGRKRKISIDLSSDEEDISDYTPSEHDSPSVAHAGKLVKDVPALKKTKTASGSGVATKTASRFGKAPGKNAFGFKTLVAPKSKPKPATTPSRAPGKHTASSTTTACPSSKPKPSTTPILQLSKRRAALRAESAIHGLFDDELEFATQCAIEAADQMEDARLPETISRMSITPAPQDESVAMLRDTVEDSGSEPDVSEFVYVGGVIVRKGEVGELRLMQE
jgi:hypothetical protein